MPTYTNQTDKVITHREKRYMTWNPGETKMLKFFVPHETLGLTMDDPLPKVRDTSTMGYWEEYILKDQETVIHLPYRETFDLSISAPEGVVKMYIGDSDIPIIIDERHDHISFYAWDMTAYLTFVGVAEESVIFVKMEARFKGEKNSRG